MKQILGYNKGTMDRSQLTVYNYYMKRINPYNVSQAIYRITGLQRSFNAMYYSQIIKGLSKELTGLMSDDTVPEAIINIIEDLKEASDTLIELAEVLETDSTDVNISDPTTVIQIPPIEEIKAVVEEVVPKETITEIKNEVKEEAVKADVPVTTVSKEAEEAAKESVKEEAAIAGAETASKITDETKSSAERENDLASSMDSYGKNTSSGATASAVVGGVAGAVGGLIVGGAIAGVTALVDKAGSVLREQEKTNIQNATQRAIEAGEKALAAGKTVTEAQQAAVEAIRGSDPNKPDTLGYLIESHARETGVTRDDYYNAINEIIETMAEESAAAAEEQSCTGDTPSCEDSEPPCEDSCSGDTQPCSDEPAPCETDEPEPVYDMDCPGDITCTSGDTP